MEPNLNENDFIDDEISYDEVSVIDEEIQKLERFLGNAARMISNMQVRMQRLFDRDDVSQADIERLLTRLEGICAIPASRLRDARGRLDQHIRMSTPLLFDEESDVQAE